MLFVHDDLKEEIYMKLPSIMLPSSTDVCKLQHSLYVLKHASRAWFERFPTTLLKFSSTYSQYNYMDDLIITYIDHGLVTKL